MTYLSILFHSCLFTLTGNDNKGSFLFMFLRGVLCKLHNTKECRLN